MPKTKSKGSRRSAFHISNAEAARQDALLIEESKRETPIQAYTPKTKKVSKPAPTDKEKLKKMGFVDLRTGIVKKMLVEKHKVLESEIATLTLKDLHKLLIKKCKKANT